MGKTSTQVKQRYLDKAYSQIAVRLQKDLVAQWEDALKADGISKAEFIRRAITQYLDSKQLPIYNIWEVITHGNKGH